MGASMIVLLIFVPIFIFVIVRAHWSRRKFLRRDSYIRGFNLSPLLLKPLRTKHPQLSPQDCQSVAIGLQQFFMAYLHSGHRYVAMPSQVADDLWHEFILHTRDYHNFCAQAFGSYLHHTPATALGNDRQQSAAGLQRCWRYTCKLEGVDPQSPTHLPLLFALDSKFMIVEGFRYLADCDSVRKLNSDGRENTRTHCGSDLGNGSSDSNSDSGDSSSDSGDSSSGSDCGGGGCGGGGD
jgi:hypothetical protein